MRGSQDPLPRPPRGESGIDVGGGASLCVTCCPSRQNPPPRKTVKVTQQLLLPRPEGPRSGGHLPTPPWRLRKQSKAARPSTHDTSTREQNTQQHVPGNPRVAAGHSLTTGNGWQSRSSSCSRTFLRTPPGNCAIPQNLPATQCAASAPAAARGGTDARAVLTQNQAGALIESP